jgi:hypothetical protein
MAISWQLEVKMKAPKKMRPENESKNFKSWHTGTGFLEFKVVPPLGAE